MQYVMTVYLFNQSFIYLLMVQNTLPSNKGSIAQYFILDHYTETIFQSIIPDTSVAKVSIAAKSQFKAF